MKLFLIYIFLAIRVMASAQVHADTTYTVTGTYKKEIKKFPFITMVKRPKVKSLNYTKDIIYKNTGSRQLHLDAYYGGIKPLKPIVVLIHGGGWKSGDRAQMQYLAQELAAHGYACFCIEYRLSAEAKYPAGIHDVKAAIKFIKDHAASYNADPAKAAVLGCSSGGQMAALIGTTNGKPEFESLDGFRQNSTVHAVINMDGILAFHHPESKEGEAAALWLGGTYEENPKQWYEASALTHVGKDTPPMFFINSGIPRFHAGQDEMIAVLSKFGIYSEVYALPDSPHSFWFFDPWFDKIVDRSVHFLDKIFKQ